MNVVAKMSRGKHNPAHSLERFMYGIYDYYHDRGMPEKRAKARMVDSTLEACTKLIRQEEDIPDHMMVIMAQQMSQALNNRGAQITKIIKEQQAKGTYTHDMLQPLHDLKAIKDSVDTFIENYTGWSELNGKGKSEGQSERGNTEK